jgi:large subunit ribosomal protein L6e
LRIGASKPVNPDIYLFFRGKMVKKYDWYPADNETTTPKRHTPKAPKLRAGVQPGKVLILLAGRFRGKRVVCLKQLKSGLLAVTGPYKINGVPVKRVNQAYTMTTSTSVDVSGVKADSITDETFKKEGKASRTKSQRFFAENAPKKTLADARKKLQKEVDTAILGKLKDTMVKKYLGARFSLTKNDAPHAMKF